MATAVHHAKGFAGVAGRDVGGDTRPLAVPAVAASEDTVWRSFPGGGVLVIGKRPATGAVTAEPGDFAVVRGRPFSLADGPVNLSGPADGVERALAALDGRFSLVAAVDGAVLLATDLLGAAGVYTATGSDGRFYFASTLGLLTACLPDAPPADHEGLAATLAGSCMVGGTTPRQGVRRLEAGGYMVVRPAERRPPQTRRYADPAEVLSDHPPAGNPAEALEAALADSLRREAAAGADALMLSGGLDSRALATGARLAGLPPPPSVTFGDWRSWDVRRATLYAATADLPHRRVPYADWTLRGWAPFIAGLSGGVSGLQTAHMIAGHDRARPAGTVFMHGFLGDALTGAHLPAEDGDPVAAVLHARQFLSDGAARRFAPALDAVTARLQDRLDGWQGLPPHSRAMLLDLTVRQATWISSTIDLCDWVTPLSLPFFHRKVMQLLFTLPADQLQKQTFYGAWLYGLRPRGPSTRRRRMSMSVYWKTHDVLDKVARATGMRRLRMVGVYDVRERYLRDRDALVRMAEAAPDATLAAALRDQMALADRDDTALLPLMLGLGAALGLSSPGRTGTGDHAGAGETVPLPRPRLAS